MARGSMINSKMINLGFVKLVENMAHMLKYIPKGDNCPELSGTAQNSRVVSQLYFSFLVFSESPKKN